jgi:hypothetical protein
MKIVAINVQVLADLGALKERDRRLPAETPAPIPRNTRLQQKKHIREAPKKELLPVPKHQNDRENAITSPTHPQIRAQAGTQA